MLVIETIFLFSTIYLSSKNLGVTLRDLIFIEDGNKDRLETGMINFHKMRLVANAITQLQTFQITPFNFHPLKNVQIFLASGTPERVEDEDVLYSKSSEYESNAYS